MNNSSYKVYTRPTSALNLVADISEGVINPQVTRSWFGGDESLTFSLQVGKDQATYLIDAFYNWLGCRFKQIADGVPFSGIISEMDLSYGAYRLRKSLIDSDVPLINKVKSTYKVKGITQQKNLFVNPGFEVLKHPSTGDSEPFDSWTGATDFTTPYADTVNQRTGSVCCAIGSISDLGWISQRQSCEAGERYYLSFWTRTDGAGGEGIYRVVNLFDDSDIIVNTYTGVSGTTYTQVEVEFIIPVTCIEFRVDLICADDNMTTVFYDDVELYKYDWEVLETNWYENAESIAKYGEFSQIFRNDDYDFTTAKIYCQNILKKHAEAVTFPVSLNTEYDYVTLDVTVSGLMALLNWKILTDSNVPEVTELIGQHTSGATTLTPVSLEGFIVGRYVALVKASGDVWASKVTVVGASTITIANGLPENFSGGSPLWPRIVSDAIEIAIDEANQFNLDYIITLNKFPVSDITATKFTSFIKEIFERNTTGYKPRFWISSDQRIRYAFFDLTVPDYYLLKDGIHKNLTGEILSGWMIQPGVFRDATYVTDKKLSGNYVADLRDCFVSVVKIRNGKSNVTLQNEFETNQEIFTQYSDIISQARIAGFWQEEPTGIRRKKYDR